MDTNETKIYLAILIAAGILGVFLVFFIATMIRHHRRNRTLYLEKLQAEMEELIQIFPKIPLSTLRIPLEVIRILQSKP